MSTYPKPITFRPWVEASEVIEKILALHAGELPAWSPSDAVNKALVEYGKTLPELPKESAPEKVE